MPFRAVTPFSELMSKSINLKIFHGFYLEDEMETVAISFFGQSSHVHYVRRHNMSHPIKKEEQSKRNVHKRHFCNRKSLFLR